MCAARVLSDFYDRVTVYERDDLPDDPANRAAVPQGRHVHLLMARGAAEFEAHFPRPARRHGRRGCADPGEPPRLHPLRRGRPRPRHDARVAGRVHRVCAEPSAPGMADPAQGARRSPTSNSCMQASPSRVRRGPQRVTGVLLDAARVDVVAADLVVDAAGPRHPAAGLVGAVGIRPPARGQRRRRHRLRHPSGAHPGGPDQGEGRRRGRVAREQPRRAGHAVLRGRHTGA